MLLVLAALQLPALLPQGALLRRSQPSLQHRPIRCCDAPPPPPPLPTQAERQIDPRGCVVRQVGEVVKMPSKWPGEYDVAQVDYVQFIGTRGAY